jgi:hypothetical protein
MLQNTDRLLVPGKMAWKVSTGPELSDGEAEAQPGQAPQPSAPPSPSLQTYSVLPQLPGIIVCGSVAFISE